MKIKYGEVKKIVDDIVPTCGDDPCDVCETRHRKLAKALKAYVSQSSNKDIICSHCSEPITPDQWARLIGNSKSPETYHDSCYQSGNKGDE